MYLEAFILIGGRSSRFGTDKAFAEFEGETLAMKAAKTVEMAFPGIDARFVAASEGQFAQHGEALLRTLVIDEKPGFGAWSALHAALFYSNAEWTLVLACDLPFVTADLLQTLAGEALNDVDAVVPRPPDGRLQPLCAIYRTKTVRNAVENAMQEGRRLRPLTSIFENVPTVIIDADPDVLRNVNTPDDLA
jgi:molybdopterin-guanine dinucleotide biosynthesis protein A